MSVFFKNIKKTNQVKKQQEEISGLLKTELFRLKRQREELVRSREDLTEKVESFTERLSFLHQEIKTVRQQNLALEKHIYVINQQVTNPFIFTPHDLEHFIGRYEKSENLTNTLMADMSKHKLTRGWTDLPFHTQGSPLYQGLNPSQLPLSSLEEREETNEMLSRSGYYLI